MGCFIPSRFQDDFSSEYDFPLMDSLETVQKVKRLQSFSHKQLCNINNNNNNNNGVSWKTLAPCLCLRVLDMHDARINMRSFINDNFERAVRTLYGYFENDSKNVNYNVKNSSIRRKRKIYLLFSNIWFDGGLMDDEFYDFIPKQNRVKRIFLNQCYGFNSKSNKIRFLPKSVEYIKGIESIGFQSRQINRVINKFKYLDTLSFDVFAGEDLFQKLRKIELMVKYSINLLSLWSEKNKRLEELHIIFDQEVHECSKSKRRVDFLKVFQKGKCPPNLHTFSVKGLTKYEGGMVHFYNEDLIKLMNQCENLKTLKLWRTAVDSQCFFGIFKKKNNLKKFWFKSEWKPFSDFNSDIDEDKFSNKSDLRILNVKGCGPISDDFFELLPECFPKLEVLIMDNLNSVTVVKSLKKLKNLKRFETACLSSRVLNALTKIETIESLKIERAFSIYVDAIIKMQNLRFLSLTGSGRETMNDFYFLTRCNIYGLRVDVKIDIETLFQFLVSKTNIIEITINGVFWKRF